MTKTLWYTPIMTKKQYLIDNMPAILEEYKTTSTDKIAEKYGVSKAMLLITMYAYLGVKNLKDYNTRHFKCTSCGTDITYDRIAQQNTYLCAKCTSIKRGRPNVTAKFEELLKKRGLTYDK